MSTEATDYRDDIPYETAKAAHCGTSFVPERRAEQERDGYHETLTSDRSELEKLADTDEKRAVLDEEFARYREGYKRRKLALLNARSRCMSSMITGPANFPVARNQKRNETAHKRLTELLEFRERALTAIRRTLCPETRPIMSGDSDAISRLSEDIAQAEALQQKMKAVNAAIRKHLKADHGAKLAALLEIGIGEEEARRLLTPDCMRSIGFPKSRLTNNGANIRRMKARLVQIERAQQTPSTTAEGNGVRLEDCPADNRVRLYFPGKPDADVRSRLKSCGFRWAPSNNCWQAYRNQRSLSVAKEFIA